MHSASSVHLFVGCVRTLKPTTFVIYTTISNPSSSHPVVVAMTLALPQSLTLPPGRRLVLYIALSIAMFLTLSHTLVIMRHVSSESMVSAHSKLTKFMPLVFTTDACAKWDPRGAAENDPANCVRAGQFRGLQAFRAKGFK